jgi:hypothetical protein
MQYRQIDWRVATMKCTPSVSHRILQGGIPADPAGSPFWPAQLGCMQHCTVHGRASAELQPCTPCRNNSHAAHGCIHHQQQAHGQGCATGTHPLFCQPADCQCVATHQCLLLVNRQTLLGHQLLLGTNTHVVQSGVDRWLTASWPWPSHTTQPSDRL